MDHLVREIKENLKLGAPPPTPAVLQTEPAPHHSPAGGKMKGSSRGGGWGGPVRHRASPYHVPPRSVVSACDSAGSGPGGADPTPESMAALRRKWASGRRRYPSTCMNNNAAAAKAAKNIDPDDPFAILQELISGGSLIKEAVRRLQKPVGCVSALAGSPGSGAGRMTPRKGVSDSGRRTAYDSEDSDNEDCRTPPEDASVQQQQQQPPSVRNRSFPCCEVGL